MKRNFSKFAVSLFAWLLLCLGAIRLPADIIENPEPTQFVKNYRTTELKKVGEISTEVDYKEFILVKVSSLTVDDEGAIYGYDKMLKKVYKFDKELKFIKRFGSEGQGPGDFHPRDLGKDKLYFAKDGNLRINDYLNHKIISMDKNGNLVKEIPIHEDILVRFLPVVDSKGSFYTISIGNGVVDMYDAKCKKVQSFLDKKLYDKFLFYKPPTILNRFKDPMPNIWEMSNMETTYYDVLPGNRLIIFLRNSAEVYIIEKSKVIRKFYVWPDREIEIYRKKADQLVLINEKNKSLPAVTFLSIFPRLVIDRDDENSFYISGRKGNNGTKYYYRYNLEGKLIEVLESKETFDLYHKQYNRFYGISKGNIKIFEPNKKAK